VQADEKNKMTEKDLSNIDIIQEAADLKSKVDELSGSKSMLLKVAQDSFIIGSKSHLNSLNPEIREELGLQMVYLTQRDPKQSEEYKAKKNEYLSLGKSYAAISFLFDLVEEDFSLLDLVLMQEILIDDGEFRKFDVFIQHPNGDKITFDKNNIQAKVEEIFNWYYSIKGDPELSPIVLAVLFHHKLVSIHPFLDGNGRISRLILNLILLKGGYFPVAIPNSQRKEYYESLVEADKGNIELLIQYFAKLSKEKLTQYLSLAEELKTIDDKKEILVLTEDGNTSMLESIFQIHGIDPETVELESYDGKDNLASAIFFANKLISKSPNLKQILIHRDRDNENPQKLKQIIQKHLRSYSLVDKTTILITKFYDIESYFLIDKHINSLYPNITIERSKALIEQATTETSATSKEKLRIAYAEYGKFGKIEDPQKRGEEINNLYDSDPIKFRYWKSVLYRLEELIASEEGLNEKANLAQYSEHIKIKEIESLIKSGST